MSLVIPSPVPKEREIPEPGTYNGVCVAAENLGLKMDYNGKDRKKCRLVFELDHTDSQGRRFILFRTYTISLHERSSLRADLESWRGKAFTDQELADGFDLKKVINQPAQLEILHKQSGETTYAQIVTINPATVPVVSSGAYKGNDR